MPWWLHIRGEARPDSLVADRGFEPGHDDGILLGGEKEGIVRSNLDLLTLEEGLERALLPLLLVFVALGVAWSLLPSGIADRAVEVSFYCVGAITLVEGLAYAVARRVRRQRAGE
jgi:hypothetical protein